jgi:hypothetical protein
MEGLDPHRLARLAESLAIGFYVLMGLAFLATVFGSPGTGLLLLILGACAHIVRVWLEDIGRAKRDGMRQRAARTGGRPNVA